MYVVPSFRDLPKKMVRWLRSVASVWNIHTMYCKGSQRIAYKIVLTSSSLTSHQTKFWILLLLRFLVIMATLAFCSLDSSLALSWFFTLISHVSSYWIVTYLSNVGPLLIRTCDGLLSKFDFQNGLWDFSGHQRKLCFGKGLVLLRSTHDRHDDATSSFQTNTPNIRAQLITPCYSSQFGIGIDATLFLYRNLSHKLYDNSRPSK